MSLIKTLHRALLMKRWYRDEKTGEDLSKSSDRTIELFLYIATHPCFISRRIYREIKRMYNRKIYHNIRTGEYQHSD